MNPMRPRLETSPADADLRLRLFWWGSVLISLLAMAASAAGVFVAGTYASETTNWAAQGIGQDVANLLLAYPLLLLLGWRVRRGSIRAYLAWLGVLFYSAYSYFLYAGFVHFNYLFLVYVAVMGASVYALIFGVAAVDPAAVAEALAMSSGRRFAGGLLLGLGVLFYLLWLSDVVPAMVTGTPPQTVVAAGLPTNPVYVLDMAIVLPAMMLAGVLLLRNRPFGYLLGPPLITFGIVMSLAVESMFVALALRDEPTALPPAVLMAVVIGLESIALSRLLRGIRPGTHLRDMFS